MKFAIAMYLAGDIAYAADCDYSSYRNLGTTCPYCSSAVHLRRRNEHTRKGKPIAVEAHFAHYKAGPEEERCEARSLSAKGREEVERIALELKGQRLELFNSRLWEIHAGDRNISSRSLKNAKQLIGAGNIDRLLPKVRSYLRGNKAALTAEIDTFVRDLAVGDPETMELYKSSLSKIARKVEEEVDKQNAYFSRANLRLHSKVCREVLDFLATNSGGYALEKFLIHSLMMIIGAGGHLDYPEIDKVSANLIVCAIAGTHWIEAIQRACKN